MPSPYFRRSQYISLVWIFMIYPSLVGQYISLVQNERYISLTLYILDVGKVLTTSRVRRVIYYALLLL